MNYLAGELKITELDTEKEVTWEYCDSKMTAQDYETHLLSCEDYKITLQADIEKNKFKEVQP